MEARDNLQRYFKENNLNPMKSYSKHPIHGQIIRDLVERLNLERAKVMDNYIEKDKKNRTKLFKLTFNKYQAMAKKIKKIKKAVAAEETQAKAKVAKKATEEKAPKKEAKVSKATKYDYPLIDGREMTADEKKKYRTQQRREAQGKAPKEAKEKVAKKPAKEEAAPAKEVKKEKKLKKASKEEKPAKVKKAKPKKVED